MSTLPINDDEFEDVRITDVRPDADADGADHLNQPRVRALQI